MSKTVDSLFVRRLAGLGLAVALAASTPLAGPAGRAEAENLSDVSIADMAERLLPSVVNISISQEGDGDAGDRPVPKVPEGQPFEEFFEDFFDGEGGPGRVGTPRTPKGAGAAAPTGEGPAAGEGPAWVRLGSGILGRTGAPPPPTRQENSRVT